MPAGRVAPLRALPSAGATLPEPSDLTPAGGTTGKPPSAADPSPMPPSPTPFDRSKEKTVTVKEAAFRLGKSADAVRLWLRTGRLRGWQPGGRWCTVLVSEASIEEALLCRAGAGQSA